MTKPEIKVGQVWKLGHGTRYRIEASVSYEGCSWLARNLDTGNRHVLYESDLHGAHVEEPPAEPTSPKEEKQPVTKPEIKVGQVWKLDGVGYLIEAGGPDRRWLARNLNTGIRQIIADDLHEQGELVTDAAEPTWQPKEQPTPIPMLLTCPACGERHIDKGEFATKPHHTHACQHCGMCWRPAVVPTVGVRFLPGFADSADPAEGRSDR